MTTQFQLVVHLPDTPPGVPRMLRKIVAWQITPRIGETVVFATASLNIGMIVHDPHGHARLHALQPEVANTVGLDVNDLIEYANELKADGFTENTEWEPQQEAG